MREERIIECDDGSTVVLRRVPIHRYDWGWRTDEAGNKIGHPKERSRFEVHVNGVLRGYITHPNGWRGGWEARRLEHDGFWYAGREVIDNRLPPEALAAKFPEYIADGYAPTIEEMAEAQREYEEAKKREAIEAEESRKRYAKERAERERQRIEAEAREAERCKTIAEALASIQDRLRDQMTNFENDSLAAAIEDYRPDAVD